MRTHRGVYFNFEKVSGNEELFIKILQLICSVLVQNSIHILDNIVNKNQWSSALNKFLDIRSFIKITFLM